MSFPCRRESTIFAFVIPWKILSLNFKYTEIQTFFNLSLFYEIKIELKLQSTPPSAPLKRGRMWIHSIKKIYFNFSSRIHTPCPIKASFCNVLTIVSICASVRSRIASTDHAIARSFFLVTGPMPGISSRRFFFISFVRFDRLNVIANRCASSRIFWNTRSSLDAISNRMDSLWYGRKTSSSRFASEHIWGCSRRLSISSWVYHSHANSHRICSRPLSMPSRAAESCHLPPSMMMRWGKFDSFIHSIYRLLITSRIEAKSSILPSGISLIWYFR